MSFKYQLTFSKVQKSVINLHFFVLTMLSSPLAPLSQMTILSTFSTSGADVGLQESSSTSSGKIGFFYVGHFFSHASCFDFVLCICCWYSAVLCSWVQLSYLYSTENARALFASSKVCSPLLGSWMRISGVTIDGFCAIVTFRIEEPWGTGGIIFSNSFEVSDATWIRNSVEEPWKKSHQDIIQSYTQYNNDEVLVPLYIFF